MTTGNPIPFGQLVDDEQHSGCYYSLEEFVKASLFLSYFMLDSEGKVVAQQKGTFRSNCMDCLDRTNVIQSLLARRSLQSQLQVGRQKGSQIVSPMLQKSCFPTFHTVSH